MRAKCEFRESMRVVSTINTLHLLVFLGYHDIYIRAYPHKAMIESGMPGNVGGLYCAGKILILIIIEMIIAYIVNVELH